MPRLNNPSHESLNDWNGLYGPHKIAPRPAVAQGRGPVFESKPDFVRTGFSCTGHGEMVDLETRSLETCHRCQGRGCHGEFPLD
jgi:hypothetical protein